MCGIFSVWTILAVNFQLAAAALRDAGAVIGEVEHNRVLALRSAAVSPAQRGSKSWSRL